MKVKIPPRPSEVVLSEIQERPNHGQHLDRGNVRLPRRTESFLLKLAEIRDIIPTQTSMSVLRGGIIAFYGVHLPEDLILPSGYGYKGGVARELLRATLGLPDRLDSTRDRDLIRLETCWPDASLDGAVAQKFSPDDAGNGHGVEMVPNLKEYLTSRDLTLNAVIWNDNALFASPRCVLDTLHGVLRLTRFERHRFEGGPNDKLIAKAFRLKAEAELDGEELRLAPIRPKVSMSNFHIALHLDRALGKGELVADRYLELLNSAGYVPARWVGEGGTIRAVNELSEGLCEGLDFFRNFKLPDPQESPISSLKMPEVFDEYEQYPRFGGFRRPHRK